MKEIPSLIKQYEPKLDEIWYHYCSAESFMAITKNKTLRFCDLRHMNDMTELIYGERLFDELLFTRKVSIEYREIIYRVLDFFRNRTFLLSFSFSENRDQLSQWRGYADEAKGFCIGFKAVDFKKFPVHLLKIDYQIEKQTELICSAIDKIAAQLSNGFDEKGALWIVELFELFSMMKNKAFCEENEFRLVRAIFVGEDGKLYDINKKDKVYKNSLHEIDFRLVDNVPTPFVDIDFMKSKISAPIRQVCVGPRNHSTKQEIDLYLLTNGIRGVHIDISPTPYRKLE